MEPNTMTAKRKNIFNVIFERSIRKHWRAFEHEQKSSNKNKPVLEKQPGPQAQHLAAFGKNQDVCQETSWAAAAFKKPGSDKVSTKNKKSRRRYQSCFQQLYKTSNKNQELHLISFKSFWKSRKNFHEYL